MCPMCHTVDQTMTAEMLAVGGGWRCITCGQHWDAARLATVAAYVEWVAARDIANGVKL